MTTLAPLFLPPCSSNWDVDKVKGLKRDSEGWVGLGPGETVEEWRHHRRTSAGDVGSVERGASWAEKSLGWSLAGRERDRLS